MSYKVIEKNEYGTKVQNTTNSWDCNLCKHDKNSCEMSFAQCNFKEYYLPDSEVEKLESENDLKAKNEELQTRIKELEATIENMKAIAGEKIEPINGISSVDYPSDNETHVTKVFDDIIQIEYAFCSKCYEQLNNVLNNENYCPNCGRKIVR